jgi:chromate transporter
MNKPIYSLKDLMLYFLKLGSTGFGGPVALVGYMHRDLVEKRQWIKEDDYKEGLALAQLAPGPLAAQLAIYLGYVHYRIAGATLAGIAFIIPSFFMVIGLGYVYVKMEGLPWLQAIFFGVGAAVIGIITFSSYKLTKKTLGKEWIRWLIFTTLMVITFITENENIWVILGAGVVYYFYKARKTVLTKTYSFFLWPVLLQLTTAAGTSGKLMHIWWFFLKAGAFVFGSGLAIVPFLYGGVVKEYQWLNEQQFVDAVAVAMITPGPVVITVGFIGYLVAGIQGACVAAFATFLPCYLFTILPAPYFKKYGKHPGIKAFIDGVTAAAIGAIAGAVLVLAKRQFFNENAEVKIIPVIIALVAFLILFRFKKIQEPVIILLAALAGLLIHSAFR